MNYTLITFSVFFFSECPDYHGQGFSRDTGHFTHLVWKSVKTYGIWAQTCDIPNTKWKCAIAFKTDGSPNQEGGYSSNVGNVGQCAKVPKATPSDMPPLDMP